MKYVKLFEEYINTINENITITPHYVNLYFKGIQKRLGAKKININQLNDLTAVDFDDKLRLFVKDNQIIGYNTDMTDVPLELGRVIKSFSDIENNLKLFGKSGKPISNPNQVKIAVPITEELPNGVKELKDGLTAADILPRGKYDWIAKCKIQDVVIGQDKNNLIWYNGTWIDGTWIDGTWKDGTWIDGTWENGTWEKGIWKNGEWEDGTWFGGIWKGGTWFDGIWRYGIWEDGLWKDGSWLDGRWKKGIWKYGKWKHGIWENGTWVDGIWLDGTWETGIWQNGKWNSTNTHPNKR